MDSYLNHLADWATNEQAILQALGEVQREAREMGLIVDRPHGTINGYPRVTHIEVRRSGRLLVLASMDVGLGPEGDMIFRSSPGGAWRLSSFHPREADFYRQELRRLVEAASAATI